MLTVIPPIPLLAVRTMVGLNKVVEVAGPNWLIAEVEVDVDVKLIDPLAVIVAEVRILIGPVLATLN